MGKDSKIEWTSHTLNPWRGCTKISPGGANCYAETLSRRNPAVLGEWGPRGKRVVAARSAWLETGAWDRRAKEADERDRVFVASLADVFEEWEGPMLDAQGRRLWATPAGTNPPWIAGNRQPNPDVRPLTMDDVRARLLHTIQWTENLDYLLLTKRPENVLPQLRRIHETLKLTGCQRGWILRWLDGDAPPNVWLGVSVEDQARADERIPHLLRTPAAVRFLSVEPMLGPVDLTAIKHPQSDAFPDHAATFNCMTGKARTLFPGCKGKPTVGRVETSRIDWVICGGESGPGARHMERKWAMALKDQCLEAGVPFFFKQWGAVVSCWNDDLPGDVVREIDASVNLAGYGGPEWFRVGKKAAGRLLDGRTWDEFPRSPKEVT